MFALLLGVAIADPTPSSPTRVTVQGTPVVHLELPTGWARWTDGTRTITLQGALVVDLFDDWAIIKHAPTNQTHVVARERVLYVGTSAPDSL